MSSRPKRSMLAAVALAAAALASAEDVPLRDPMRPYSPAVPGTVQTAEPRYVLTAVLVSATRRIAVVNGRRLREGDTVDGAELLSIHARGVELRRGGERFTVELGRPQR